MSDTGGIGIGDTFDQAQGIVNLGGNAACLTAKLRGSPKGASSGVWGALNLYKLLFILWGGLGVLIV